MSVDPFTPLATEPLAAKSGLSLAAYAAAKRLPPAFLKSLGMHEGRHALSIPYRDAAGTTIATRFRLALEKGADGDRRFLWRAGTTIVPYGLDRLGDARQRGFAVLVEGESDCHCLWLNVIPALGIPGSGCWKDEWASYLDGIEKIYAIREPDAGGKGFIQALGRSPLASRLTVVDLPFKDPAEMWVALGEDRFKHEFLCALDAASPAQNPAAAEDDWTAGHDCRDIHAEVIGAITDTIQKDRLVVDAIGRLRRRVGGRLASTDVAAMCRAIAFDLRRDRSIDTGYINETADEIIAKMARLRRKELDGKILGKQSSIDAVAEVRRWLKAVTDRVAEPDLLAVLHWLWIVKRKLAGMPVDRHLMLVLTGSAQGTGKSTAVKCLCSELAELFDPTVTAEVINDERNAPVLAQRAVGLWDEMQGIRGADITRLKHLITTEDVSYRPMRTNSRYSVPMLMTFIGTSNESIADLVRDTTGMRRFYELAVPGRCDWDVINDIDYALIWQAASEEADSPLTGKEVLVEAVQSQLRHRDGVSLWLDEETFKARTVPSPDGGGSIFLPERDPTTEVIPTSELHLRARLWCVRYQECKRRRKIRPRNRPSRPSVPEQNQASAGPI